MLFHMSIDAERPEHVAKVLAELWGGVALPFPPVTQEAWIAMAGDDRGTAIEVYPGGTQLLEYDGDGDAYGVPGPLLAKIATHAAIGSSLNEREVIAIADREGWPAKYRNRGGLFGVIEVWIEGRQMIEVLTPQMQQDYQRTMTPAGWQRLLEAGPPA